LRSGQAVRRMLRSSPALTGTVLRAVQLVPSHALRSRMYRSVSWPLARGLATRLEVRTPGGRMIVDTGDTVGCVVAVSGVWEPHVTEVFRRLVRPGDVVVDVGAHIGYYTLLASRLVGGDGHVYAFEPTPARFAELRTNLELNGVTNVTALELAAGAANATATLFEAPRANTSASTIAPRAALESFAESDVPRWQVKVTRAADHIASEHRSHVRVMKVDVEGAEIDALRGLEQLMSGDAPVAVLVEISPRWSEESPTPFLERLCARHALTPWLVPNEYSVTDYFPAEIKSPVPVSAIPDERADLVLARGLDVGGRV
jgi:FkbM family methyltransferase